MAPPKRKEKPLLENPLAASSSEDEEVEKEVEEERKGSAVKKPKFDPKTPHSSSDDDDDDEEEEDASEESDSEPETPPKLKPIASKSKKNAVKPSSSAKSDPKTPSSSDDEEEDEPEESDSEPETPPKLKPIASKPKMTVLKPSSSAKPDSKTPSDDDEEEDDESEESDTEPETPPKLKPKKTVSSVTPLKSSSKVKKKKRPFVSEKDSERKKKKKKKQKVDDEGGEDEEESLRNNTPFQRIWSDEDEIVILKGMIESKKNGVDPLSDLKEFLESIKKFLQVKEVRQEQLKNKIQRLRKKFMNNSKRAKGDEDPVFSRPHEQLSYTLMKQIWGGKNSVVVASGKDDVDSVVVADGRRSSSRLRKFKNAAVSPVRIKMMTLSDDISSMELDGSNGYLHPCVQEWIFPRNDMNVVGGSFFKQGLDLIGDSEKMDFEQKWRSLIVDELKIYLRRVELVREQTIAILDAHKSTDALEHE